MDRRGLLRFTATLAPTCAFAGCSSLLRGEYEEQPPEQPMTCETASPAETEASLVGDDTWRSIYGDFGNTGFSPDRSGPSDCPERLWVWEYSEHFTSPISASPVLADSTIFVCDESPYYSDDSGATPDNNSVIAIDARDGSEQWRLDAGGAADNHPALFDEVLYVPENGHLTSIDVAAGERLWRRDLGFDGMDADHEILSPPVVDDDGLVYTALPSGNVFALDAADGSVVWTFETQGLDRDRLPEPDEISRPDEARLDGAIHAPLSLADETLYVPSWDRRVYALDKHTGEQRWTYSTHRGEHGDQPQAPAVAGDTVYIGTENGLYYAVDADTGTERWEFTDWRFAQGVSPGVDSDRVYATAGESVPETRLVALDREAGTLEWERPIARPTHGPIIDGNSVYLQSGSELVAVDALTGEFDWIFEMSGGGLTVPLLANGAIFFLDGNGFLYAVG